MCLLKKTTHHIRQKGPVKVYKVLLESDRSPYRYQKYHWGMNVPDTEETALQDHRFITDGYLHAYTTRGMAEFYAMKYQLRQLISGKAIAPVNVKVVEMYIPEDTIYWTGYDSDIAAKKLYWPEEENIDQ
jgi:hypothetical protein